MVVGWPLDPDLNVGRQSGSIAYLALGGSKTAKSITDSYRLVPTNFAFGVSLGDALYVESRT